MSSEGSGRQQSRHLPAFILLLLGETPMHGGALQSVLKSRLPALKADSAAVYRTLKQLEKDGEVVSNWVTADSGPAIRVYKLTPVGWKKLDYWRADIEGRLESLNFFVAAYARLIGSRAKAGAGSGTRKGQGA
jgi:PadR family transcriptional regulator, regulatory protein PadR